MRAGPGGFDQLRGLAEIGVHAGRRDHAGHLAELDHRSGIRGVTHRLVDRERLARQRGFVRAAQFLQRLPDNACSQTQDIPHDSKRTPSCKV